jgi:uncharacterized membrane protein
MVIHKVFIATLFMAYPYLVFKAIENGISWVAPVIFSVIFLRKAVNKDKNILNILIAILLLLGAFYLQEITATILPVIIQLILMSFFGKTLLLNSGPSLIERFVRLEFSDFPPGVSEYCRSLTVIWTAFFAFNAIVCITLSIFGNNAQWALFNGIVIYLMIGILVIAEYIYRHIRFPDLIIPDPISTIRTMVVNGQKVWMDVQGNDK